MEAAETLLKQGYKPTPAPHKKFTSDTRVPCLFPAIITMLTEGTKLRDVASERGKFGRCLAFHGCANSEKVPEVGKVRGCHDFGRLSKKFLRPSLQLKERDIRITGAQ